MKKIKLVIGFLTIPPKEEGHGQGIHKIENIGLLPPDSEPIPTPYFIVENESGEFNLHKADKVGDKLVIERIDKPIFTGSRDDAVAEFMRRAHPLVEEAAKLSYGDGARTVSNINTPTAPGIH